MARKKIVYLLGAGASYNSLPIIETMVPRMLYYLEYLVQLFPKYHLEISEYLDLCKEMKFFKTPDTLAKQRFLTNKNDFSVKKLLTTFLIFEQLKKEDETYKFYHKKFVIDALDDEIKSGWASLNNFTNQLDSRYLSFFATILKSNSNKFPHEKLPKNISIISWNYDLQVEYAFQKFFSESFCEAQRSLSCFPALTHHDKKLPPFFSSRMLTDDYCPEFGLIKLNGSAGYKVKDSDTLYDPLKHSTNRETMEMLLKALLEPRDSGNVLSFGWEDTNLVREARDIAKEKIKEASTLVIIGYSFPDFNREIDRELFEDKKFEQVYLQDPKAADIKQKLDGVNQWMRDSTQVETQTDSFIIPRQYWEEA